MAVRPQTEIDALAAPTRDGEALFWPRHSELLTLADANRRLRRSYRFRILNDSFPDLLRDELQRPPIIMTGHQPGFIHPGVWAKNVVASRLAARLGGEAQFLLVDSDAAPRSLLTWPDIADGFCRVDSITSPAWLAGCSYEQLPAVPDETWRAAFQRLPAQQQGDAASAMSMFLRVFIDGSPAPDYVTRWTSGMEAVEHLLGVASPRFVRDSELWSAGGASLAASRFTAHLLLHADEFLAAYNAALDVYRDRRGIRGRRHPIPNLARDGDRRETPFWVLRTSQPRRRLFVSTEGIGAIRLWAATESICTLSAADLASNAGPALAEALGEWRIRPRALALTMFARLFACDLFVHGIGGAKYDQTTDDIIRRFLGVEPPAYACVSATCHLPLPAFDVTAADLAACVRRLRDLTCNPQRYLESDPDPTSALARLIAARTSAIAESARLRLEEPRRHADRRAAFTRIRQTNAALLDRLPDAIDQTRHVLARIEAQLAHNSLAAGRDWFFALYPTDRLLRLRDALNSQIQVNV